MQKTQCMFRSLICYKLTFLYHKHLSERYNLICELTTLMWKSNIHKIDVSVYAVLKIGISTIYVLRTLEAIPLVS